MPRHVVNHVFSIEFVVRKKEMMVLVLTTLTVVTFVLFMLFVLFRDSKITLRLKKNDLKIRLLEDNVAKLTTQLITFNLGWIEDLKKTHMINAHTNHLFDQTTADDSIDEDYPMRPPSTRNPQ